VGRTVSSPAPFAARASSAGSPRAVADASLFKSMDVSRDALAAYDRGDQAASLAQFQAAVDADPNNPDALNNLGQLLVRTGRARDAIPYFDRAIQVAGTVWAYRFNRARAYAQLEQWSIAIAGYRDAGRLFPDDYVTEFNLAKALQAHGDLEAAITGFERAIALAPGQADFHLSHGLALEAARRPAAAAAAYRRYLELEEAAPAAEKIKERIAALVP
jgi:tetratricopeptide (TPR) repeat protein